MSFLPDFLSPEDWEDFLEHRKAMKKPMSQVAIKRMWRRLEEFHKSGQNISACIDQSIRNGWQDVFKERVDREQQNMNLEAYADAHGLHAKPGESEKVWHSRIQRHMGARH